MNQNPVKPDEPSSLKVNFSEMTRSLTEEEVFDELTDDEKEQVELLSPEDLERMLGHVSVNMSKDIAEILGQRLRDPAKSSFNDFGFAATANKIYARWDYKRFHHGYFGSNVRQITSQIMFTDLRILSNNTKINELRSTAGSKINRITPFGGASDYKHCPLFCPNNMGIHVVEEANKMFINPLGHEGWQVVTSFKANHQGNMQTITRTPYMEYIEVLRQIIDEICEEMNINFDTIVKALAMRLFPVTLQTSELFSNSSVSGAPQDDALTTGEHKAMKHMSTKDKRGNYGTNVLQSLIVSAGDKALEGANAGLVNCYNAMIQREFASQMTQRKMTMKRTGGKLHGAGGANYEQGGFFAMWGPLEKPLMNLKKKCPTLFEKCFSGGELTVDPETFYSLGLASNFAVGGKHMNFVTYPIERAYKVVAHCSENSASEKEAVEAITQRYEDWCKGLYLQAVAGIKDAGYGNIFPTEGKLVSSIGTMSDSGVQSVPLVFHKILTGASGKLGDVGFKRSDFTQLLRESSCLRFNCHRPYAQQDQQKGTGNKAINSNLGPTLPEKIRMRFQEAYGEIDAKLGRRKDNKFDGTNIEQLFLLAKAKTYLGPMIYISNGTEYGLLRYKGEDWDTVTTACDTVKRTGEEAKFKQETKRIRIDGEKFPVQLRAVPRPLVSLKRKSTENITSAVKKYRVNESAKVKNLADRVLKHLTIAASLLTSQPGTSSQMQIEDAEDDRMDFSHNLKRTIEAKGTKLRVSTQLYTDADMVKTRELFKTTVADDTLETAFLTSCTIDDLQYVATQKTVDQTLNDGKALFSIMQTGVDHAEQLKLCQVYAQHRIANYKAGALTENEYTKKMDILAFEIKRQNLNVKISNRAGLSLIGDAYYFMAIYACKSKMVLNLCSLEFNE